MTSGNGSAEPTGPISESNRDQLFTRNPCVTIIHCGEDEIVAKHGSRSRFTKNVRDEGKTRLLGRILRNVVPPVSLATLEERKLVSQGELEDAAALVSYLLDEGILVRPEEDPTRSYLRTVLGASAPLSTKSVGVVGAGPLGCRIALELAAAGVGRLVLLDGRVVQNAEIERSFFAYEPRFLDPGKPFVSSLAQALGERSPCTVEARPGDLTDEAVVQSLTADVDFVVLALEQFSARTLHMVNSVALTHRKPWISSYIDGSEALIGPLYVPGESCCYNEFEIQHEATLGGLKDDYLLYKETLDASQEIASPPILPAYLSIASGIAVSGILRFLLSGRSFLVGRANRFDFDRLSLDYEEVLRLPRCPACALNRPGYRALFM
jgi:thiazole/oxazole-forming peptide maturase SagC family component